MAEKFKKRLSRRAQERLNRALRTFDLTILGIVVVAAVCAVISFRGTTLINGYASSGFAYWFLVVVGAPPMLLINLFRTMRQMDIPAQGKYTELYLLSTVVFVWVTALWLTIRIIGKRNTKSQLLHISTRMAQIILFWGVFQICCWAITVGWNRGGNRFCRHDRTVQVKTEISAPAADDQKKK